MHKNCAQQSGKNILPKYVYWFALQKIVILQNKTTHTFLCYKEKQFELQKSELNETFRSQNRRKRSNRQSLWTWRFPQKNHRNGIHKWTKR